MKETLEDLQVKYDHPTIINCDGATSINIFKNLIMHSKTNNIPIKYHYLREQVSLKTIKQEYVDTKEHVVDIFTKPLPRETFEYMKQKL